MGGFGQMPGFAWREQVARRDPVMKRSHRAVLLAAVLLLPALAACGKDTAAVDEAAADGAETVTMDAAPGTMVGNDVLVGDMLDESATDQIAEMAPPADPMMEMPATEPGQ